MKLQLLGILLLLLLACPQQEENKKSQGSSGSVSTNTASNSKNTITDRFFWLIGYNGNKEQQVESKEPDPCPNNNSK